MTDLKEIKQAMCLTDYSHPFIEKWSKCSKAMPQEWTQLSSAVLESEPKLLSRCFLKGKREF